jgi:hypothetical protein
VLSSYSTWAKFHWIGSELVVRQILGELGRTYTSACFTFQAQLCTQGWKKSCKSCSLSPALDKNIW